MKIRRAEVTDAKCIARLHINVWRDTYMGIMPDSLLDNMDIDEYEKRWSKTLKDPGKGRYLVVDAGKELVGFATFGPARDEDLEGMNSAELVALNISSDYWRQNIGTDLLSAIIDSVKGNYKNLYLWVAEKNDRAISFYEKFGFIQDGKTKTGNSHGNIVELRYVLQMTSLGSSH